VDRLRRLYLSAIGLEEPALFPATRPSVPANARSAHSGMGGTAVPAEPGGKRMSLEQVRERLGDCRRCPLAERRRNLVFGAGDPAAELVFVGEAPGRDEDEQGVPFVGAAGQKLTEIIAAMGLARGQVYICNVLKCRPPENRVPQPNEVAACSPFLHEQLLAVAPRVLVTLGAYPARTLLGTDARIGSLRGRFHDWQGIPLMPTWHPAYLLRNPAAKRETWEDVKQVMKLLGLRDPRRA
jgi:uracil-DNA glycosylase family 4